MSNTHKNYRRNKYVKYTVVTGKLKRHFYSQNVYGRLSYLWVHGNKSNSKLVQVGAISHLALGGSYPKTTPC